MGIRGGVILLPWLVIILFSPTIDAGESLGDPHIFAGEPKSTSERSKFHALKNLAYDVGYSEMYKDPLWSAYHLRWTDTPQHAPRAAKFLTDDRTEAKVRHEDYTQKRPTVYDRGHMTPNYAIVSRYGAEAQKETFFMSNICPQKATLNQQTWRYLEAVVAKAYSDAFTDLWVVAGPIFDKKPKFLNDVSAIPKAFFMILVGKDEAGELHMLGIVMDQNVKGKQELKKFVKPVNGIQKATGLDFFTDLPDDKETELESSEPDDTWEIEQVLGQ